MDEQLGCDFYIGDIKGSSIKKMDYKSLKGFKGVLNNIEIPRILRPFIRFRRCWLGAMKPILSKQYKIYIVTGETFTFEVRFLLKWAKAHDKKVILWGHGWRKESRSVKEENKERRIYNSASHIMPYGEQARDFMIAHGIPKDKMTCVYNSLDYAVQLKVRADLKKNSLYKDYFKNDDPVLLYIGRLQKSKKLPLVLEAMSLLRDKGINTNFVMIGNNSDLDGIDTLIHQFGLDDRVWIYGPLYDEQKKGEMMYNADICVSPGNVGLTALDTFMYGLPLITHGDPFSTGPEYETLNDGVNGLFFKKDSAADLAEKINEWLIIRKTKAPSEIEDACHKPVDEKWNTYNQMTVISDVVGKVRAIKNQR